MNTQKVSLKIQYTTSFGENLFVSGTYWGDWQQAIPLTWHEGGNWECVFDVDLGCAPELALEYKYLVRNSATGATRWEATANRRLTVAREATGKSLLVSDAWEHPEATRVRPGLTRAEEAAEAQRRRAEEAEARRKGLDFFKESLRNSKREAESRRRKEEEELVSRERQRSSRANEERQRREKILSSRHATMAPATAAGAAAGAAAVPASEAIVINPAMQAEMVYNGTTSPIMPFMPRYSSSPRDFSLMNARTQHGLKTQHQQESYAVEDDDVVDDDQ